VGNAELIGESKEGKMFDEEDGRDALMAVVDTLLIVALALEVVALAGF
jgi:hypothetical protein